MDSTLITLLTNAGLAGVVVVLLLTGVLVTGREHKRLEDDCEKKQQALDLERERNNTLMVWAVTGTKALQAVEQVARERSGGDPEAKQQC